MVSCLNRSICYYLLVSVHRFKRQISDKQVWKNGGNPYFTRVFAVLNILLFKEHFKFALHLGQ